ncbi:hypothetical protein HKD37_03G008519 [Glycine soja]
MWTALEDFYQSTGDHRVTLTYYGQIVFLLTIFKTNNHLKSFPKWHALYHQVPNSITFNDVPSNMYYFMKDKGLTYLNLEDIVECHVVYNNERKTIKIGAGLNFFCETQSFEPDMEIVFEFADPTVNYVLF